MNKSILFENGLDQGEIAGIKVFFPLQVSSLSLDSKYMGYFIKPNGYSVGHWYWILKRFDKRINHRCW